MPLAHPCTSTLGGVPARSYRFFASVLTMRPWDEITRCARVVCSLGFRGLVSGSEFKGLLNCERSSL